VSIIDAAEKHMEVIVDDTQLSLAIGKKGQNVRLAAKLLGWKIDIKSEEEKRQEVESAMAALVPAGAPVSILMDHGLEEEIVEKLLGAGINTVEKLGAMTPEELEAIPEIGPVVVEKILVAVNSYYAQFEQPAPPVEETVPLSEAGDLGLDESVEAAAEGALALETESPSGGVLEAGSDGHADSPDRKGEFDTIKNSEDVG
jgi:N utilization substance protein A